MKGTAAHFMADSTTCISGMEMLSNTEIVFLFFHMFMDPFSPPRQAQPSSPLPAMSIPHTFAVIANYSCHPLMGVDTSTPSISLAPVALWLLGSGGYINIYFIYSCPT